MKEPFTKYGTFSEDKTEFIIHRPDTPAPWVNYISNGSYNGLISHTGGGFSFYRSPRDSRITRWRYNSLPIDRPGRYIYLRDKQSGEYWSPTWQPAFTKLDKYECRHGMFYTQISSQYKQLKHSILYFVPSDDLEIWKVSLKNNSAAVRDFDVFSFVELCLGHALVDLINQPNDQHFNEVSFDQQSKILYAGKRYWVRFKGATVKQANEAWDKTVFISSSLPIKGWDGSKDCFIGRWRSEENPAAVEQGNCFNTEITSGDAAGALQMEVKLQPGEEKEFVILMGAAPADSSRQEAERLVEKYRDLKAANAEFNKLKEEWRTYLNAVQVNTPDSDMNTMLNVWNQYQNAVTFKFSRDASYYHGGMLFGRGFRDSCQDIMGPLMARPDWIRERIEQMGRYQFADGSAFHLYLPLSGTGERTGHSDTQLWLPFAIIMYLKETADFNFLNQEIPFYDEGKAGLFEHLTAAVDYTLANLTERYLAKIGPGDWNDTLDYLGREGRGESVWVTMFLAYILKETIGLCRYLEKNDLAGHYQAEYDKVKKAVNDHCWDGNWYFRATNDKGGKIGSAENKEGKIFLNAQTWAVMSGIADGERAEKCMRYAREMLDTPKGPKILHPAYTKIDPDVGLATRCVPGKKENGAVFNHPVSWSIAAECLLGRGDRAFDIYKKSLPMNPEIDIDRYQVEPFVYSEYVTSPDHPTYGQASHSWLTGSAAWMLRGGIDYILGIRPDYAGLIIDPCIPADWKSYKVERNFRGRRFIINVSNPNRKNGGVKEITIEGMKIKGSLIDLTNTDIQMILDGKSEINVNVLLG